VVAFFVLLSHDTAWRGHVPAAVFIESLFGKMAWLLAAEGPRSNHPTPRHPPHPLPRRRPLSHRPTSRAAECRSEGMVVIWLLLPSLPPPIAKRQKACKSEGCGMTTSSRSLVCGAGSLFRGWGKGATSVAFSRRFAPLLQCATVLTLTYASQITGKKMHSTLWYLQVGTLSVSTHNIYISPVQQMKPFPHPLRDLGRKNPPCSRPLRTLIVAI